MKKEIVEKILFETKVGYKQIAKHFSATRDASWRSPSQFFIYLKPGDQILDIGCGNGRLYQDLKKLGVNYLGIDQVEEFILLASQKYGQEKFLVADVLNLKLPSQSFDAVFLKAVLPHFPSKELQVIALKNIYQVLKPGGYLFITCWNLWQPKLFWQNFKNRIKNPKLYKDLDFKYFMIAWKNSQGQILSQRFYYAFTKKELKKILERTGFQVEKIYYEYKGEKSNWSKGFNLVVIARAVKI